MTASPHPGPPPFPQVSGVLSTCPFRMQPSPPPPPGGPQAWSSQSPPTPRSQASGRLGGKRGNVGPTGQKPGAPAPRLPAHRAPLWSLNTGPLPHPPQHTESLRGGGQAWSVAADAPTPSQLPAPRCAGPRPLPRDVTALAPAPAPIVHSATKLLLFPGHGGWPCLSRTGPLSSSPPPSTRESAKRKHLGTPSPLPHLHTPTFPAAARPMLAGVGWD